MEQEVKEFLSCKCTDSSHLMVMSYSDDGQEDREVVCEILLCPGRRFSTRLAYAIRYLFGTRPRNQGPFDCVILGPEHAKKLHRMAEFLEGGNN